MNVLLLNKTRLCTTLTSAPSAESTENVTVCKADLLKKDKLKTLKSAPSGDSTDNESVLKPDLLKNLFFEFHQLHSQYQFEVACYTVLLSLKKTAKLPKRCLPLSLKKSRFARMYQLKR